MTMIPALAGLALASLPAHQLPSGCGDEEPGFARSIYCLELVPTPDLIGTDAWVRLDPADSPFEVAARPDGSQVTALTSEISGLPPASSLGEYEGYVAWVAGPLLYPMIRLGSVSDGLQRLGETSLAQFLILITAEADTTTSERSGRIVLRGFSPSTQLDVHSLTMLPPGGTAGHQRWPMQPMPAFVPPMPALMGLEPVYDPWFPSPPDESALVDAVPREIYRLADGDTVTLESGFVRRRIRNRDLIMYGFNGQYPGPLLQVDEAATIHVRFVNSIDLPSSIHWHGVRIENQFDGAVGVTQDAVQPGEEFLYRIRFPDPGIYWYHPHHREDIQQELGLYGNMLVSPADPAYFPLADHSEFLVLDDLLLADSTIHPFSTSGATHALMGRFGNLLLVNGETEWRFEAGLNEIVRLYLTNVSNTRTFNISFGGAPIKILASDLGRFEWEEIVESVIIAPAERYVVDVLVDRPGRLPLINGTQSLIHTTGQIVTEIDTLGYIVADTSGNQSADEFFDLRVNRTVSEEIARYLEHADRAPDHRLELTLETDSLPFMVREMMKNDSLYFTPVEWAATMPMMNRVVTNREADWIIRDLDTGHENMDIDWTFERGDVAKIGITNNRHALHAMQHPVHLHGQRFLVLSLNGVPTSNFVWKDTFLLPVGSTAEILVEMSNPGRWMLHCHIAEHLETGMKMVFTVH